MKSTAVTSAVIEGIYYAYYDAGSYSVNKVMEGCSKYARFEVLTAVIMRNQHFLDMTPCLLIHVELSNTRSHPSSLTDMG